jgi:hypothetical protein
MSKPPSGASMSGMESGQWLLVPRLQGMRNKHPYSGSMFITDIIAVAGLLLNKKSIN